MVALIFLPILLVLVAIAFADRVPPPMPKNPCKCGGCEVERRARNDMPISRHTKGGHRA